MTSGDHVRLSRHAAASYCIPETPGLVLELSASGHLARVEFGSSRRWVGVADLARAPRAVAA